MALVRGIIRLNMGRIRSRGRAKIEAPMRRSLGGEHIWKLGEGQILIMIILCDIYLDMCKCN